MFALLIFLCCTNPEEVTKSEYYESDGVTVTLEWAEETSLYINITPYLSFNFSGSTTVHFKVPYNIAYDIGVVTTPPNPCGQNDIHFEVYYGELNRTN